MSSEERRTATGRLVEEYAAVRRELALTLNDAQRCAKTLCEVADGLLAGDLPKSMDSYPDRDRLGMLARNVADLERRKGDLASRLRDVGVDPKD